MKDKPRRQFKRSGTFYTYIVECSDGTYYTGYTPDIKKRLDLHNMGRGAKYTRDRRPVTLVWYKEHKYFKNAFLEEIRIKKMTRRQKEKLIETYEGSAQKDIGFSPVSPKIRCDL